jgi:PPOX class probable F420-dependent enzyme
MELPEKVKAMLDGTNFAHVATLNADGSPQNTVVWADRDGDLITFNTAEGRVKTDNMRRDPRVSISIYQEGTPYINAAIMGRVVKMTHDGADEHIDSLSMKYMGEPYRWRTPDMVRVKIYIEADSIGGYVRDAH